MQQKKAVEETIGKTILEYILADVDAARIGMNQMDNIAGHSDLPEVVFGNHYKRTREEKGISDRKEMMEILSDWYVNEEVKKYWQSREAIVKKLIEIMRDPNVACYRLAEKLKISLVSYCIFLNYFFRFLIFSGGAGKRKA